MGSETQANAIEPALLTAVPSLQIDGDLLARYHDLLLRYTDDMDMGIDGDQGLMQRRTNEALARNKRGQGRPDRLTVDLVYDHLAGTVVLHTHPARGGGKIWFQVDIDAHDKQQDVGTAADLICSLFPGSYWEPSTHGKGIHVYIWVNQFRDKERYNVIHAKCQELLARLFVHRGIRSTVEMKHTFTLMKHGAVVRRGQLAKAPRLPNGINSFLQFADAPVWPLPQVINKLRSALTDAGLQSRIHRNKLRGGAKTNNIPRKSSCRSLSTVWQRQNRTHIPQGRALTNMSSPAWHDNSFVRMLRACWHYIRLNKRVPEENELLEHYRDVYQRDEADKNRVRRATGTIRQVLKVYEKANGAYRRYVAEEYLSLAKMIPECLRNGERARYPYEITYEDLAIAIYCLERASFVMQDNPNNQYTFGEGSIQAMFKKLREAHETKRGCNNHKELAIRRILQKAKMMEYLDTGYIVNWVGKKAAIGPMHPLYRQFQELLAFYPVVTASQIRMDWDKKPVENEPAPANPATAPTISQESPKAPTKAKPSSSFILTEDGLSSTKRRKTDPDLGQLRARYGGYSGFPSETDEAKEEQYLLWRHQGAQKAAAALRRRAKGKEMRRLAKDKLLEWGYLSYPGAPVSEVNKVDLRKAEKAARQEMRKPGFEYGRLLPSEEWT